MIKILDKTVVLANGSFPKGESALHILRSAERVVCCDGAADSFVNWGGKPTIIIGDCDSVTENVLNSFPHLNVENQDHNDLYKAIEYCIGQGWHKITILGATGLRDDFTLANLGILMEFCDRCEIELVTDYGIFNAITKMTEFDSFAGQQVSLFTLDDSTEISETGLVYQPPQNHLKGLWQGASNESKGDKFTVHTNGLSLVYRTF